MPRLASRTATARPIDCADRDAPGQHLASQLAPRRIALEPQANVVAGNPHDERRCEQQPGGVTERGNVRPVGHVHDQRIGLRFAQLRELEEDDPKCRLDRFRGGPKHRHPVVDGQPVA